MITIIFLLIDQIIKYLITTNMYEGQSINIINNFFKITYVTNDGAAFNFFSGKLLFLILIAVATTIYIIKNIKKLDKTERKIYELLLAGILGNLIDRIFRKEVIDYMDFKIFNLDMAIFNFADMCIVISCVLLIILEVTKWKKSQ